VSGAAVSGDLGARAEWILEVKGLQKFFPVRRGLLRRTVGQVRAVDGVSFELRAGETLSLVGESGCGKTTTSRCILRALPPTAGSILFRTDEGPVVDVATLPKRQLRPLRRQMQMIFQDPFSSLNPRRTLLDIVAEPLVANGVGTRQDRIDRVAELLRVVGLRPEFMRRYPHAFSGGQRQRVGIARALALHPRLIVLLDLQAQLGLTYLFVAHDLSVVKHVSDRVAVMYVGRIVEVAETEPLFARPRHPYTEALLSAVPEPDPRRRVQRIVLEGEVADPANVPPGCAFHPRCRYAIPRCRDEVPALEPVAPGHLVSCHRARELTLAGVAG
jgi:peptide/nickel transport system ATP-binding protein